MRTGFHAAAIIAAVIWFALNGLLWYAKPSDVLWLLGSAILGVIFLSALPEVVRRGKMGSWQQIIRMPFGTPVGEVTKTRTAPLRCSRPLLHNRCAETSPTARPLREKACRPTPIPCGACRSSSRRARDISRHFNRLVLEWRGHGVVPAIEETEQRDHADDFNDLFFAPVLAQLGEHFVGDRIGHRGRRDCKIERGPLGSAVERARLILPHCGELLVLHPKMKRTTCGVRHAIPAPGGAARDMRDDALEVLGPPHPEGPIQQRSSAPALWRVLACAA